MGLDYRGDVLPVGFKYFVGTFGCVSAISLLTIDEGIHEVYSGASGIYGPYQDVSMHFASLKKHYLTG